MSKKDKSQSEELKVVLAMILLMFGMTCLVMGHTVLATFLIIAAICVIFGSGILGQTSKKERAKALYDLETESEEDDETEPDAEYEPAPEAEYEASPEPEFKPVMMECPFCGKIIPAANSFCYYCGRSLESYKKIEEIRLDSLARIDAALEGIDGDTDRESTAKKNISKIRTLSDKILRKYAEDPEDYDSYDRFTDYYLPKTVAAIEQYSILCGLENLGSEETRIKNKLEDTIDLLAEVYSNIFNKASTEKLFDISTDVSALENIVKLNGLTDPDFKL